MQIVHRLFDLLLLLFYYHDDALQCLFSLIQQRTL